MQEVFANTLEASLEHSERFLRGSEGNLLVSTSSSKVSGGSRRDRAPQGNINRPARRSGEGR
jgi:hypothetical protein